MDNNRLNFDYRELRHFLVEQMQYYNNSREIAGYQNCTDMVEQFFLDKLKLTIVTKGE